MRSLVNAACLTAAVLVTAPAWAQDAAALFPGAWRMVSLEVGNAAGELAPVEYSGQIVFTDAGTMSVQAKNPDADAPDGPYTVDGYEAFYGSFLIDEDDRTFVVTVESSLVPDLIGQDLQRAFEISDDRLVLTPTNPEESWRVVYERY
jgi:hypothetical protein